MKENTLLIICDCLRTDHAYSSKIMPFLHSFSKENSYTDEAYTNAPSTHLAMPTMLTGAMPFQKTSKEGINPHNIDTYIAKIAQDHDLTTTFITTNVVTSHAFGYDSYWDNFQDFWTKTAYINELKKRIQHAVPKEFWRKFVRPITKKSGSMIKSPTRVKDEIRGKRILEELKKTSLAENGNLLILHFMDPHSPYAPEKSSFSDKEINEVNAKLSSNPKKITAEEGELLKKLYTKECRALDSTLKDTLSYLQKILDWKNTRVVITSDHGEAFGETGYYEHPRTRIDNPNHLRIPLITKGFPLTKKNEFWTGDIYNMLLPENTPSIKTYSIAVCYEIDRKVSKGLVKDYLPTRYRTKGSSTKVQSSDDLPYKLDASARSASLIDSLEI